MGNRVSPTSPGDNGGDHSGRLCQRGPAAPAPHEVPTVSAERWQRPQRVPLGSRAQRLLLWQLQGGRAEGRWCPARPTDSHAHVLPGLAALLTEAPDTLETLPQLDRPKGQLSVQPEVARTGLTELTQPQTGLHTEPGLCSHPRREELDRLGMSQRPLLHTWTVTLRLSAIKDIKTRTGPRTTCRLILGPSRWLILSPPYWLTLNPSYWLIQSPPYWLILGPSCWLILGLSCWLILGPTCWLILAPSCWLVQGPFS